MAVYDEERQKTTPDNDELRRLTGINSDQEGAMEREAYNGAAEDVARREGLSSEDRQEKSDSSATQTPRQLWDAEERSAARAGGNFGFNPQDKSGGGLRGALNIASKHKKSLAIGGGAAGGITAIFIAVFFAFIPLKIEHIMNNLQRRFFGTTEKAVGDMSEVMLSHYIKKAVLPALTKCSGTTRDKNCNPSITDTTGNPVSNLYKGWKNAKLENTLAEKYNIEFKSVKSGSVITYYLKTPGIPDPNGIDITQFTNPNDNGNLFQQVNRTDLRQQVKTAFENESRWTKLMMRWKVGVLLDQKYGLRRCIGHCDSILTKKRDAFADFKDQKKNAAKIWTVQRVLGPVSVAKAIAVECIMDPGCNPRETHPKAEEEQEEGKDGALNGAPENPHTDLALRKTMQERAARLYGVHDSATIDAAIKEHANMLEKGLHRYSTDILLDKLGLGGLSDKITRAVPVIGWITTASDVVTGLHNLGPSYKKLSFMIRSTGAVSMYSMYRTYADEIHTGQVDATEVGAMIETFGPGDKGTSKHSQAGGTAGAEGAPLYQELMTGNSTSTTASAWDELLPQTVYAATNTSSTTTPQHICDDGKPPAANTTCPEEKLVDELDPANKVSSILSSRGVSVITSVAAPISAASSVIGDAIGSLLAFIPGVNGLSDLVNSVLAPIFDGVNSMFTTGFSTVMSGSRIFTLIAGGGAAAGAESGQHAIGGKALEPQEVIAINNQRESEARQRFARKPVFARLFSTDSEYSLVSRVAMSIPIAHTGTLTQLSFTNLLSDPFSKVTSSFGSLFSSKVHAQNTSFDPFGAFGIKGYGYTDADIAAIGDPEKYWNDHNCGDKSKNGPTYKWNEAASKTFDPNTNAPMNTETNPCLLIKATVGSAGGYFSKDNLTNDELISTGSN